MWNKISKFSKLLPQAGSPRPPLGPVDSFDVQPLTFDRTRGSWIQSETDVKGVDKAELVVATLNTWFGEYFFERRFEAITEILRAADPDIIGLQEITRESLDILAQVPWIRDQYSISDIDESTFEGYGVVMLSRLPIRRLQVHVLPGPMGRQIAVGEYLLNGESLHVAVVHLESLRTSTPIRVQQLHTLFELLKATRHSIIMGDFNFCASWQENDFLDPSYTDIWSALYPNDTGYTEDTEINKMHAFVARKSKQVRFDRILLQSQEPGWVPNGIRRFGMEPVSPHLPLVFPSDHFGLIGKLTWQDQEQARQRGRS